ncbi:hypothetical protein J6590_028385, partial [Homalodisca vitripennis]
MSPEASVGFLVLVSWQFYNANSCLPDDASCFFDFECCSGGCSLRDIGGGSSFVCDISHTTAGSTPTQVSTTEYSTSSTMTPATPPRSPTTPRLLTRPPSSTPPPSGSPQLTSTSYTSQSTSGFSTHPTLFTTDLNDYSTMPSLETAPPTPSRPPTPPRPRTPLTPSLPPTQSTLSTTEANPYRTVSSTETPQPLPITPSEDKCRIPGNR